MYDQYTRDQLTKMLRWYIGVETGFAINPGKLGKYFQRFLDPDLWKMLLKTYADGSYENTWDGLFTMCDLFRIIAVRVADHFGYIYNQSEDENMTAFTCGTSARCRGTRRRCTKDVPRTKAISSLLPRMWEKGWG